MSKMGHNFDLPIPDDVQPGPGWTEQMLEMADHIGAYRTLLVVERYGGQRIYIAANPERNVLRELIGPEAAATMSRVYRREFLMIPTAKFALAHARRRDIIAAVRAKLMTATEAARMLGTSRPYMSFLVNQTDEGTGDEALPSREDRGSSGQMYLFGDEED